MNDLLSGYVVVVFWFVVGGIVLAALPWIGALLISLLTGTL